MIISGGKYAAEVEAGRVFWGTTAAAGVALPIATGTAVTFAIWNTSKTKKAVPLKFGGGFTSGTIALGSLGFANQQVGYATGTGAPLAAATSGTAKNAKLNDGNASSMVFIPATATLTSGGTALLYTGNSIESASAGTGIQPWNYDFDGLVTVMPGEILFACSSVAQTGLFSMALAWAEVDL